MFRNIKESFRRVSWWGFFALILAAISVVVFIFGTVQAATYLVGLAVFLTLAGILDDPTQ